MLMAYALIAELCIVHDTGSTGNIAGQGTRYQLLLAFCMRSGTPQIPVAWQVLALPGGSCDELKNMRTLKCYGIGQGYTLLMSFREPSKPGVKTMRQAFGYDLSDDELTPMEGEGEGPAGSPLVVRGPSAKTIKAAGQLVFKVGVFPAHTLSTHRVID